VASGCLPTAPADPSLELQARTVMVGDRPRGYYVATPRGGDATARRPLLLLYHGAGGTARDMLFDNGLAMAAVDAGFVVAALEAVPGYGGRWATNPVDLAVADDVAFTRQVVADVGTAMRVDPDAVFAVGYSRGGDFVYQLACRAPELVRGVAAVAATTLYTTREWCSADTASIAPAMLVVLGTVDPLMPWSGGLPNRMGALETTDYWASHYACNPRPPEQQPVPARQGYAVTRYVYPRCARGSVTLYGADPLRHVWPAAAFDVDGMLVSTFVELSRAPRHPSP